MFTFFNNMIHSRSCIQTPNVALSSEVSSNANDVEGPEQAHHPGNVRRLGWLRTMISLEKTLTQKWSTDSQGSFYSL